jgi:hypothetical protein
MPFKNEENAKRTVISLTVGVELAAAVIKTIAGDDIASTLESAPLTGDMLRAAIVTEFNAVISEDMKHAN